MLNKIIYAVSFCIGLSSLAYGQTTDSVRISLQSVNVTANRSAQENFNTAGSVNVLSANSLQIYQPRTVPEALTGTTGVFIQKTTHGAGSPFLRGLTGNQTLILIDGIRLNNSTFRYGPNQYLNTIDPFTINRIEVFRGGGSVAYGSDALGGTIHLLTNPLSFTEKATFNGRGTARYATGNMEKTLRAEGLITTARLALHAGISIRNFGDLIGGDTTGKQSPSGYKERAFDVKGLIKLTDNLTLTLAHQYLQQHHIPLYYRYHLENFMLNEFDPQRRNLSYFKLAGKSTSKWLHEVTLNGSFQATKEGRVSQRNASSALRTETDEVKTSGLTINVQSALMNNWTASSGVEVYHDKVNSNRIDQVSSNTQPATSRGLYPDNSKYSNYAVYSLHHIEYNKWQFSFGGRFNGFRIQVPDDKLGNTIISPKALVGNAALSYTLHTSSNVYVSFNSAFRAPNIDDMGTLGVVDFRYELPAYNLKPEKSYNLEAGYKFRQNNIAINAAVFNNNIRNLIARVQVPGQKIEGIDVYKKENVERAYIRGAELEGE
jgi:hemoglobin/transferrin/lactoferrin receptor protein